MKEEYVYLGLKNEEELWYYQTTGGLYPPEKKIPLTDDLKYTALAPFAKAIIDNKPVKWIERNSFEEVTLNLFNLEEDLFEIPYEALQHLMSEKTKEWYLKKQHNNTIFETLIPIKNHKDVFNRVSLYSVSANFIFKPEDYDLAKKLDNFFQVLNVLSEKGYIGESILKRTNIVVPKIYDYNICFISVFLTHKFEKAWRKAIKQAKRKNPNYYLFREDFLNNIIRKKYFFRDGRLNYSQIKELNK